MAFTKKLLGITVALSPSAPLFDESGTNQVTLPSLRASARIQNSGSPGGSTMTLSVYGMTLSLMNQLSTLGMIVNLIPKNVITVTAGDAENGQTIVFVGTITQAYGDFSAQPNVPFTFECNSGLLENVVAVPPSSFTGPTDVAVIMAGLAKLMSKDFINHGVTGVMISSPYLWGSAGDQYKALARHAHIHAEIINGTNLEIWPWNGTRQTGPIPLIAPGSGMKGYPAYTAQGIVVQTEFNPQISFGGQVQVQSSLPRATGTWQVTKLDHALDTQVPSGDWFSTIYGYNPKYPIPTPPP